MLLDFASCGDVDVKMSGLHGKVEEMADLSALETNVMNTEQMDTIVRMLAVRMATCGTFACRMTRGSWRN